MDSLEKKPLVSVIMASYNHEAFVLEALESVLNQEIEEMEIIVVDDGSSNNYMEEIRDIDKRIVYICQEQKGPSSARNTGMRVANGEFIAFLDSDDLWHKNKIEKIISASKLAPEANFFCHNEIHRLADKQETILDYSVGYRNDLPLASQLFKRNLFSTSAVVCQKDRAIEVGGFDEALSSAQDYEFWFRMTPGLKVNFVREVLGVYVERPGNISSGKIWRRYSNLLKVLFRHRKLVTRKIFIGSVLRNSAAYIYYWIMSGKYIGGLWR